MIRDFFGKYGAFKWFLISIGTLAALVLACVANFKKVVVVEAGEKFDVMSIWSTDIKLPTTAEDIIDTETVGLQCCKISILGLFQTSIMVDVQDTTPPVVETTEHVIRYGDTCNPEMFVKGAQDVTEVTYAFVNEPNTALVGKQTVLIEATDAHGNITVVDAELEIVGLRAMYVVGFEDAIPEANVFSMDAIYTVEYVTEPDGEITKVPGDYEVAVLVNGVEDKVILRVVDDVEPVITTDTIKVTVNSSLSYKKNINFSDNWDNEDQLTLEIDNTGVDLSKVGQYTIVCKVTDSAGNTATKEIVVDVVEQGTEVYTLEQINKYADEILGRIINDSMTLEEKAYAIYRYTRSNIGYISDSQQTDWLMGAYEGMVKHLGCCFTYAATAKALLERIGLEPLVIYKEKADWTSQSNHYWLLLDLGDGYYHFDPTPRADGTWFFMWTDEQLLEYSNAHRGSHNFTRDKYPEIK